MKNLISSISVVVKLQQWLIVQSDMCSSVKPVQYGEIN